MTTYLDQHGNIIKAKDDFTQGFKRKLEALRYQPTAHMRIGRFAIVTVWQHSTPHNPTRCFSLIIGEAFPDELNYGNWTNKDHLESYMKDRLSQLRHIELHVIGHPQECRVRAAIAAERSHIQAIRSAR